MLVRVRRLNNGVEFMPVTKTGKPVARVTKKTKQALYCALNRYVAEVLSALTSLGMGQCGYAEAINDSYLRIDRGRGDTGGWLPLEPWGIATLDENGTPTMGDTGSTPTEGRARVLWAYQAPLTFDPRYGWHATWECA